MADQTSGSCDESGDIVQRWDWYGDGTEITGAETLTESVRNCPATHEIRQSTLGSGQRDCKGFDFWVRYSDSDRERSRKSTSKIDKSQLTEPIST